MWSRLSSYSATSSGVMSSKAPWVAWQARHRVLLSFDGRDRQPVLFDPGYDHVLAAPVRAVALDALDRVEREGRFGRLVEVLELLVVLLRGHAVGPETRVLVVEVLERVVGDSRGSSCSTDVVAVRIAEGARSATSWTGRGTARRSRSTPRCRGCSGRGCTPDRRRPGCGPSRDRGRPRSRC